jgi:predicted metal-dependent hydrolase
MGYINYGKHQIEYTIKHGKRKKTLGINITPAAQVIVLAPKFLNEERIHKIVKNRAKWIIEKQDYFKKMAQLYPERKFVSGESILLLGRRYRLKILKTQQDDIIKMKFSGRKVLITADEYLSYAERYEMIKTALIDWYKTKAYEIVQQRIERYSKLLGIEPKKFLICDQEKRWGSCSRASILRFNWRIIMAPMSVIDYVVVHELCHLKIKNHSINFWKNISLVLPDYEKRRLWLRDNVGVFRL